MFQNLTPDQVNTLISAGAGLLGAVIGAAASLASVWAARKVQKCGKISLHVKPVWSKTGLYEQMGFYPFEHLNGLDMDVPIWLDVCNTSGISRVVRNFSLHAYYQKKEVGEFTQIQSAEANKKFIPLGENEAYTLVIPADSAKRYNMEFLLNENEMLSDQKQFDELIFTYFDEKNRMHAYHWIKVESCWKQGPLDVPQGWMTLKRRCRYAR